MRVAPSAAMICLTAFSCGWTRPGKLCKPRQADKLHIPLIGQVDPAQAFCRQPSRNESVMISFMRFFVMLILVLLLPLGSGLGDAMAAGSHHNTTQEHRASTHAAAAHELADCLGHGTTTGKASPAANDVKPVDADCDACSACSACQTCQAVGLVFSRAYLQPLPAAKAKPQALSPAFASATAERNQKPPIS